MIRHGAPSITFAVPVQFLPELRTIAGPAGRQQKIQTHRKTEIIRTGTVPLFAAGGRIWRLPSPPTFGRADAVKTSGPAGGEIDRKNPLELDVRKPGSKHRQCCGRSNMNRKNDEFQAIRPIEFSATRQENRGDVDQDLSLIGIRPTSLKSEVGGREEKRPSAKEIPISSQLTRSR